MMTPCLAPSCQGCMSTPDDVFDKEAELILDRFVRDEESGDLYRLQQAIVAALHRAFAKGKSDHSGSH